MLSQRIHQTPALTTRDKAQISRLINSIYYFINIVYILEKDNQFRLIAIQAGKVLIDKTYSTFTGAKIAFSKFFQEKAWNEDVKAEWTDFYNPDRQWLDENMKLVEKAH
jgi:hypothetical protein